MKTKGLLTIGILFALISCNSGEKSNVQKVSFGIYETIKVKEISDSLTDKLKTINIQPENNIELPIIGYLLKNDSIDLQYENIKLLKTAYPIDEEGKYYALVAVKDKPVISNSDIKKTINKSKNIEIHFNLSGAKKWAEMTRNCKGNMVAFSVDNQIYDMPYINGEIRTEIALISNLENETKAKEISESLNSSISD